MIYDDHSVPVVVDPNPDGDPERALMGEVDAARIHLEEAPVSADTPPPDVAQDVSINTVRYQIAMFDHGEMCYQRVVDLDPVTQTRMSYLKTSCSGML